MRFATLRILIARVSACESSPKSNLNLFVSLFFSPFASFLFYFYPADSFFSNSNSLRLALLIEGNLIRFRDFVSIAEQRFLIKHSHESRFENIYWILIFKVGGLGEKGEFKFKVHRKIAEYFINHLFHKIFRITDFTVLYNW